MVPERCRPLVVSERVLRPRQPVGRPALSRAVAYSSRAAHELEPGLRNETLISRNFSGNPITSDCPAGANVTCGVLLRASWVKAVHPLAALPRWIEQDQVTGRDGALSHGKQG